MVYTGIDFSGSCTGAGEKIKSKLVFLLPILYDHIKKIQPCIKKKKKRRTTHQEHGGVRIIIDFVVASYFNQVVFNQ